MARKILLADDSVTAQNMGRKILADAGYEVITVNNGSAALKKIAEHKPDLIVLDVYMPGYSGLEVCQRLKEAQETSRVPVLLTVGKLEPFKPEEAKRVRADGFIVKPFEASELLSALSKLEDKIVPRAEASKPGRFARVTAAIEEGRYDKTVAIQEDLGWKNRIAFPSKKKEKSAPEDGESPAIDNSTAERPRAKAEETRVDLGALAPEGLPKDVTPEEIAALAAAAAQVKGKMAESRFAEAAPTEARTEETQQTQPAAALPQHVTAAVSPAATFAEQKSEEKSVQNFAEKIEEKIGAPLEKSGEAAAAVSPSDLITAIESLQPDGVTLPGASLGNGFSSQGAVDQTADEPVTMAAAAGSGSVGESQRWTAVSVALGSEEAAISLQHEMQKAYAAFAAAEGGHRTSVTSAPETGLSSVERTAAAESSSPSEAALAEPVGSIPAMPAPEAAQALSALANASTETIRAAVQELEMVAESYVGETATPPGFGTASMAETGTTAHPVPEVPQTVEASARESSTAAKSESTKHDEAGLWYEPRNQAGKNQDRKSEDRKSEDRNDEEQKNEEPFVAAAAPGEGDRGTEERREIVAPTFVNEAPAERTSASQVSSYVEASTEPAAEGKGEITHRESDVNTAAAWASWRRIRESGDLGAASEEPSQKEAGTSTPQAAMAVAAGAEKTPEEASAESESDPAAIASIVDSVLADLRPKIFEEISRKMAKKK